MDARPILIRRVEKGHSKYAQVASHCRPGINFDFAPITYHHHTAKLCEETQVLREVYIGKHLENHIDTGTIRQLNYLIRVVCRVVIECVMRALLCNVFSTLLRSSGADHRQPGRSRELNRSRADATRRPVNEHRLTRFALAFLKKSSISCGIRNAQRGALFISYVWWQSMYLPFVTHALLG